MPRTFECPECGWYHPTSTVRAGVECPNRTPPAPAMQYTITNAKDEYPLHTNSYTYAMHALYNRAVSEGRADLIDRVTGQHLILTNNT